MSDIERNEQSRQQELFPNTETPETDAGTGEAEKPLSFEAAMEKLEQVVARLESSEVSLDQSLELFQEGTRLARLCSSMLASIEHKVTKLVAQPDGTLKEEPLEENPDE